MCPEVNSASKKWIQGIPLGVKAAGAWGWRPTTLIAPNVKKSGALTYPDPLGPSRRPVVGETFTFTFRLTLSFCFYICNAMKFRSLTISLTENCTLLDFYAANSGNSLTTFRDMSITSSWPLKMEAIDFPKTSVKNYNYSLCNSPEERGSHLLRDGSLTSRTRLPVRKDFPYNLLTPASSIGSLRRATWNNS